MRNRTFFVLLAILTVGGLAFSQTILGAMFKLGAFTTGTLPTSSATIQGALVYDSDAGVIRHNNGVEWLSAPLEAFFSASLAPGGTGAAATTMIRFRATRAGRATRMSYTTTSAGTGGGTFTLELYNATTTTVLCSRTLGSCTTVGSYSSGACTNAVWAPADDLELRVDTSGCTTNPGISGMVGATGP